MLAALEESEHIIPLIVPKILAKGLGKLDSGYCNIREKTGRRGGGMVAASAAWTPVSQEKQSVPDPQLCCGEVSPTDAWP